MRGERSQDKIKKVLLGNTRCVEQGLLKWADLCYLQCHLTGKGMAVANDIL